jgi:hypothetical protein
VYWQLEEGKAFDAVTKLGSICLYQVLPGIQASDHLWCSAVKVKVDKVSATLSAHTVTVSGSAVTHTVVNGQARWCIDYGGGNSVCLKDEDTYPAQGTSTGGLYLQGDTLYQLELNGSVYTVDERFTKQ